MLNDEQFLEYLALCEHIAERMYQDGIWPWDARSQNNQLSDQ